MPPLLISMFGANLELVFPFVQALDPDMEVIVFTGARRRRLLHTFELPFRFPAWPSLPHGCLYLDYALGQMLSAYSLAGAAPSSLPGYPERCKKLILAATACSA